MITNFLVLNTDKNELVIFDPKLEYCSALYVGLLKQYIRCLQRFKIQQP